MADFKVAYDITSKFEGGYSFDKDDFGGETYKGISRKYHPSWLGWKIVDSNDMGDPNLQKLVLLFYKSNFWDPNLLTEFPSQHIANEMFDTGVNIGVKTAAMFLQKALNVLNKNGKLYSDMIVDGIIGDQTMISLKWLVKNVGDKELYKVLNIFQGAHYVNVMMKHPVQEKFAYGWLKRVEFVRV